MEPLFGQAAQKLLASLSRGEGSSSKNWENEKEYAADWSSIFFLVVRGGGRFSLYKQGRKERETAVEMGVGKVVRKFRR
jgi:hypothetical protein